MADTAHAIAVLVDEFGRVRAILAEFRRRDVHVAGEVAVERRQRVVADVVGDLGDRGVGLDQHLARLVDAHAVEVLEAGAAHLALEEARKS